MPLKRTQQDLNLEQPNFQWWCCSVYWLIWSSSCIVNIESNAYHEVKIEYWMPLNCCKDNLWIQTLLIAWIHMLLSCIPNVYGHWSSCLLLWRALNSVLHYLSFHIKDCVASVSPHLANEQLDPAFQIWDFQMHWKQNAAALLNHDSLVSCCFMDYFM